MSGRPVWHGRRFPLLWHAAIHEAGHAAVTEQLGGKVLGIDITQYSPTEYGGGCFSDVSVTTGWVRVRMAVSMAGCLASGTNRGCVADREHVHRYMDLLEPGEREQVAMEAARLAASIVEDGHDAILSRAIRVVNEFIAENGEPTEAVDLSFKHGDGDDVTYWAGDWAPQDERPHTSATELSTSFYDNGAPMSPEVAVGMHRGDPAAVLLMEMEKAEGEWECQGCGDEFECICEAPELTDEEYKRRDAEMAAARAALRKPVVAPVEVPQARRLPVRPTELEAAQSPDQPTTPSLTGGGANANTGGTGMSSIEEVRAGIGLANDKASESLGALQQAHSSLEQAQGALMRVTEGSGQADVSEANGLLAQAVGSILEVQQAVSAAIQVAEGVEARL